MPASLNEEGIEVPPNLELSPLDKAFITLTYPRTNIPTGGLTVTDALVIVNVPNNVSGDILSSLAANKLDEVREKFCTYNMTVMKQVAGKSHP
jgi:hypothetical protein